MEPAGLEFSRIREAAGVIQNGIPFTPQIGILLGTGLGEWLQAQEVEAEISYSSIPHLLPPTVPAHAGKVYAAHIGSIPVLLFSGRSHYYEGYSLQEIVRPVRIMHVLGCTHLIVTNAAGGISPDFETGDIVLIKDHINLTQLSPLQGPHDDRWGSRFPDMRGAYDPAWREWLSIRMKEKNIDLHSGVYAFTAGSNLETPAEYEFMHRIGSDMVGMSTVPEVIAARQSGLTVLGISVISNVCYPPVRVVPVTEQSAIQVMLSRNTFIRDILEIAVQY